MLCIGLNFFLWCFVTPYFSVHSNVRSYRTQNFYASLYFGYLFESLIINKSLETFAIIDAAAIEVIFFITSNNSFIFYFILLGAKRPSM